MINLLSNAFKFTAEDGTISVMVSVLRRDLETKHPQSKNDESTKLLADNNSPTHVQIIISDTGIGIPEDRLPYVFDRFYSIDSLHMSEQEGSGIGLTLTKELVDLHHGEIIVNSRVGKGTEFTIRLPLGKDHLQEYEMFDESVHDKKAEPDISGVELEDVEEDEDFIEQYYESSVMPKESVGRYQILIVEDNADVRNYIREHLEPDYEVAEAPNGTLGVEFALKNIPNLIISDIMMPEMDGYELCRVLKNDIHTSHIPIILLTAKAEDSDKITGLKIGADDYLIKPFNSQELLIRIKNIIDLRHKLQKKYKMEFLLQPNEIAVESMDDVFLKKACDIVEANISDPEFSVEALSKKIGMSRVNLYRKLRAVVNQSASEFIRSLRLKRAAQLLQKHVGNITEVTFQVGFTSTAYFSKCFREQFGIPPSEYIKKSQMS